MAHSGLDRVISASYRFDPATGTFTAFHHSEVAGSLSNDVVNAVLVDRSGRFGPARLMA